MDKEPILGAFFLLRMNDHLQYLNRFHATLDGRGDFHGTDHHSCKLGIWLDTKGPTEISGIGPDAQALFESIFEPHQRFHEASSQALELKEAGNLVAAEEKLTEMHQLSALLVDKLLKLDTLAAGKK